MVAEIGVSVPHPGESVKVTPPVLPDPVAVNVIELEPASSVELTPLGKVMATGLPLLPQAVMKTKRAKANRLRATQILRMESPWYNQF
jgi:hypothetical protein